MRGIEPAAIKKVDELAKTKRISRNEFLKIYIENLSVLDSLKNNQIRYEETLHQVSKVLEKQTKEVAELRKLIMHISGLNESELYAFTNNEIGEISGRKN